MDLKNPTRTESLLANIAGYTGVPVPDMKNATRTERLLKEILDNGGGGGGDVTKEYVDNAISNAVADIDDDISALSDTVADKVDKVNGKSLSTNDYTDADKVLVQNSPITVTSTTSPISTANGKPRKLAIYGKSEVVDGAIKSAGEGWATVDLGTLDWSYSQNYPTPIFGTDAVALGCKTSSDKFVCKLYQPELNAWYTPNNNMKIASGASNLNITNLNYTDATAFKTAMSGVILAYELADPSQGNTIAIKTDNGSGIDGTMATFTTGTPLYGIDENTRDVMTWNGSAGTVTKNCGVDNLGIHTWNVSGSADHSFYIGINDRDIQSNTVITNLADYTQVYSVDELATTDKSFLCRIGTTALIFHDTAYTNPIDFGTSMNEKMLIYKLATPTTTPLTQAENESIAGLKTYSPSTTVTINDASDYSIEAYANTANGQMISDMQPTRSPLLTLTASGWTNNTQTVTYEHDIGKRNSIDVEPTSIKAWTAAGILATSETATSITFECDTVPTSDLSFRVTSMEVR